MDREDVVVIGATIAYGAVYSLISFFAFPQGLIFYITYGCTVVMLINSLVAIYITDNAFGFAMVPINIIAVLLQTAVSITLMHFPDIALGIVIWMEAIVIVPHTILCYFF